MYKRTSLPVLVFLGVSALFFQSCVSVKSYQKSRINDSEMELSARKSEKFESGFQLYREGAAGASQANAFERSDAPEAFQYAGDAVRTLYSQHGLSCQQCDAGG